jgi:hypothetical protein
MNKIFILILFTSSLVFSQSQEELLNKAFEQKSYKLLDKFFENWRMEKTPISDEEYQKLSDIEKDVYDVFYEFYNPKINHKIDFSKKNSAENSFDKYVKFYVMDTKINYGILFSDNYDSLMRIHWRNEHKGSKKYNNSLYIYNPFIENDKLNESEIYNYFYDEYLFDSISTCEHISDFRPFIKDTLVKILYYNPKYDSIISKFIEYSVEEKGGYEPYELIRTNSVKTGFLREYIHTIGNQCREHSVLRTVPTVKKIVFTKKRDFAKISYETPYYYGFSNYKKIYGKWKFVRNHQDCNL